MNFLAFAAAAGLIAGMALAPATAAPVSVQKTAKSGNTLDYLRTAASSDQYEIQSSQLAISNDSDPAISDFAREMIKDHQRTTQVLKHAAQSAGISAPAPRLLPEHTQMLTALRAKGSDFAKTYLAQQKQAHQQALQLQRNYARNGDTPALREAAQKAAAVIEEHIRHLDRLNRR